MKPYFEKMTEFGRTLSEGQIKSTEENLRQIKDVEAQVKDAVEKVKTAGFPAEKINARGQMTVWQRLEYLVDPGTWCPLHTLYNPEDNEEGHHQRVRRSGQDFGQVGRDHRFRQQGDGRRLAARARRKHPAGHRPGQTAATSRWSGWSTAAASNCRSGKVLRRPPRRRHPLFPSCRTGTARHSGAGRHLRHQSGRRRLPGHQPDHPVRPQGLQHRRGRRGHRQRHVAQGVFRRGRAEADHRGRQAVQGQTAGIGRDPLR